MDFEFMADLLDQRGFDPPPSSFHAVSRIGSVPSKPRLPWKVPRCPPQASRTPPQEQFAKPMVE
jgi:hypothetical protein